MELPAVLDEGLYAHTDRYTLEEEPEGAVNTTLYVDDTLNGERHVVQTNAGERWRIQKSVHILEALEDADTPVPRVAYDGSDANVPYYVMERAPGTALQDGYRERGVDAAADVADQVGAALGAAHTYVDVNGYGRMLADGTGLVPFDGAPTWPEALALQSTLWLDKIADLTDRPVVERARDTMGAVLTRMPEEPEPALLHRDCRPGNVLHDDGTVTAVLDWDNAIAGDPAYDAVRTEDAFADWFGEESGPVREAFRDGYSRYAEPVEDEELHTAYRFASFLDKTGGCAFLLDRGDLDSESFDQMLDWLADREAAARDTLEQL